MHWSKIILGLLFATSGLFAQNVVTCSSDDMRRHYCGVDTRGGVRIVRQRSDAACRQGSTWGYDRSGIWVDRGCRADFQVGAGGSGSGWGWGRNRDRGYGYGRDRDYGYGRDRDYGYGRDTYGYGGYGRNGGYAQSLYCASDDMRRHYCGVDTSGGVRILRQRSDAACRMGSTWGYDRRGIWVDRGCRADFEVGGSGYYGNGRRF
jgi:hypothetical protein